MRFRLDFDLSFVGAGIPTTPIPNIDWIRERVAAKIVDTQYGNRIIVDREGWVTTGDEPCINCPHDLDAHGSGVEGGYMKCDNGCDCSGFCDRASTYRLD